MKTLVFCLVILSLAVGICSVSASVVNSEESAKSLGAGYAQKAGWDYGLPSEAKLIDLPQHGKAWRVEFSGASLIHLSQATGDVISLTDLSAGTLLCSDEPIKESITEQAAYAAAQMALVNFGIPPSTAFLNSYKDNNTKEWRFRWARMLGAIPYQDDTIQIRISPIDGKMLGYGKHFISAPPSNSQVVATKEAAIANAREIAGQLGLSNSATITADAELKIVQPTYYWTESLDRNIPYVGGPTRIAWIVALGEPHERKNFWIDATDGSLLGGDQVKGGNYLTKRLHRKPPAPTSSPANKSHDAATPSAPAAVPMK